MLLRKVTVMFRRMLRRQRLLQIALLIGFCFLGEQCTRLLGLPLPGGIVGMLLALVMLERGRLSSHSLRLGANWFIAEMLLFFVPAVMILLEHLDFLGLLGLKLVVVILVGTVMVMVGTALIVEFSQRWSMRRALD